MLFRVSSPGCCSFLLLLCLDFCPPVATSSCCTSAMYPVSTSTGNGTRWLMCCNRSASNLQRSKRCSTWRTAAAVAAAAAAAAAVAVRYSLFETFGRFVQFAGWCRNQSFLMSSSSSAICRNYVMAIFAWSAMCTIRGQWKCGIRSTLFLRRRYCRFVAPENSHPARGLSC